jgi:hypothetical protein
MINVKYKITRQPGGWQEITYDEKAGGNSVMQVSAAGRIPRKPARTKELLIYERG